MFKSTQMRLVNQTILNKKIIVNVIGCGHFNDLLKACKSFIHCIFWIMLINTYPSFVEAQIESLIPQIISIRPHDPSAFTQGLCVKEDFLYESTGLYGHSSLKLIDLQTNQVIQQLSLSSQYFAEGIALINNQLIQLTWKEGVALVYDSKNFELIKSHSYKGDGWGLCCDGKHLFMSNGTDKIVIRDPQTFSIINQYSVKYKNQKILFLNDLECVGDSLYVNIWGKEIILRLDKLTGKVTGVINASGLLTNQEKAKAGSQGVLNGIAYYPSHSTFFLTGKYWPWIFEVQFIPANF